MPDMQRHVLVVLVLVSLIDTCISTSSDVQTPEASLKEHVKKIDEILAEIQSHSQAQEQKNSAVLSSVLSQLAQTTDELGDLKSSHNETKMKLESTILELELLKIHNETLEDKDAELSKLWASGNATILELDELHAKHNNVVMELADTKSKLEHFIALSNLNGYIGFYGAIAKGKNVLANKTIIFDRIPYNHGAWYKKISQKYLVPMNGTYQIWIDFKYRSPGSFRRFFIQRNNQIIGQAFGSSSDVHETASTTTMAYLEKGDSIWVKPNQNVYLDTSCNFGIVLLNAH